MNDNTAEYMQSTGSLFQLGQLLRIFPDSKTMVDLIQREGSDEINRKLDDLLIECANDLEEALGGRQTPGEPGRPERSDQVLKIVRRLNQLACQLESLIEWGFTQSAETAKEAPYSDSMEEHVARMWWALTRLPVDRPAGSNLLELRHPYVVAGGRYLEFFYWDSYYISVGLMASGRISMLENTVKNMAELIRKYHFVPNGMRAYFLTRSQAPHFAMLLRLLAKAKGKAAAEEYRDALALEHQFWSSDARTYSLSGGDGLKLNHYWDDLRPSGPLSDADLLHTIARPESYREDIRTCYRATEAGVSTWEWQRILTDLRAACESGWDFSSRWLRASPAGDWPLWSIRTTSILPIDLNCLCYSMERLLAAWEAPTQKTDSYAGTASFEQQAEQRRAALCNAPFWQQNPGWFYDVAVEPHNELASTGVDSLAGVFALFCEVATPQQAEAVASRIEKEYLKPGGVVTSLEEFESGQQWDFPNGWAPLQWPTIAGLVNYHYDDLAREIARRFVAHARRVYNRTGRMMEKYDVVDLDRPGGGGEYPNQVGFGWTNGVVTACIRFLDEGIFWQ
jgi:alpha,alpha-trehalase